VAVITVNSAQQAILDSSARGAAYLIDMEWLSGTGYYTSFVTPITANGHVYTALGSVLSVSQLRESENLGLEKLALGISIVDTAMLAYAIGPAAEYRNRAIRIYVQLLNDRWVPVEAPMLRWAGVMDKVRVERKVSAGGGGSGSIDMTCIRAGLSRFRKSVGLRMSHEQQQLEFPGDMGLEYTEALLKEPPVWVSKAFQKV
jgi:hypothetical protein